MHLQHTHGHRPTLGLGAPAGFGAAAGLAPAPFALPAAPGSVLAAAERTLHMLQSHEQQSRSDRRTSFHMPSLLEPEDKLERQKRDADPAKPCMKRTVRWQGPQAHDFRVAMVPCNQFVSRQQPPAKTTPARTTGEPLGIQEMCPQWVIRPDKFSGRVREERISVPCKTLRPNQG